MKSRTKLLTFFVLTVLALMLFSSFTASDSFAAGTNSSGTSHGVAVSNSPDNQSGATSTTPLANNYPIGNLQSLQEGLATVESQLHSLGKGTDSVGLAASVGYIVRFRAENISPGMQWTLGIYRNISPPSLSLPLYSALFHENVGLVLSDSTSSPFLNVTLQSGSYQYYYGTSGTMIGPFGLNVAKSFEVNISFPRFYPVSFSESGLPAGVSWNVLTSSTLYGPYGIMSYNSSVSSTITAYLPNGSYSYVYGPLSSYIESSTSYTPTIVVAGNPVQKVLSIPGTEKVTFQATGLATGSSWLMFGFGSTFSASSVLFVNSSIGPNVTAYLPLGNYTYDSSAENVTKLGSFLLCTYNASEVVVFHFPAVYPVTFNEYGLESGLSWNVEITSFSTSINESVAASNSSFSSAIVINVPSGTYNYSAGEAGSFFVNGILNVTGGAVTLSVTLPIVYRVTVSESGLFKAMVWSLQAYVPTFYQIGNTSYAEYVSAYSNETTASSLSFYLPEGSYNYSYSESTSSGIILFPVLSQSISSQTLPFNVTGAPVTLNAPFPALYKVNLAPSGLVPGIQWTVSTVYYPPYPYNSSSFIEFYSNSSASSSSMAAYLVNGTYSVSAGVQGTYINTGMILNVSGSGKNITVVFPKLYEVTFLVTGIPVCSRAIIYVNTLNYSVSYLNYSSSAPMLAYLPSGPYVYSLTLESGATFSGNFTVFSSPEIVNISLSKAYRVTFNETGLPSSTLWTVQLGSSYLSSTNSTISTLSFNGTYQYFVFSYGYNATPSSGNLTVNGGPVTINVTFGGYALPTFYTVTFIESGLPLGTTWNVTMAGFTQSTPTTGMTFSVTNGTYVFTVQEVPGFAATPNNGTVHVRGSNQTVNITFSLIHLTPATYSVTFSESGLPSGTAFSLTFNGTSYSSTTGSLSILVQNGTYSFSIIAANGFSVSPENGSITVDGQNVTETVAFAKIILNGYLTGTISPSNAYITVNGSEGTTVNITHTVDGKFNISLPPGTYQIEITSGGYQKYVTNVTISSSNVTNVPISSLAKSSPLPKPSTFPLYLIAIIVVVIVAIAAVVSYMYYKKRKFAQE